MLTNAAGQTLAFYNSRINADLTNEGLLIARSYSGINGQLTTTADSTLQVASASYYDSYLTVASGF